MRRAILAERTATADTPARTQAPAMPQNHGYTNAKAVPCRDHMEPGYIGACPTPVLGKPAPDTARVTASDGIFPAGAASAVRHDWL